MTHNNDGKILLPIARAAISSALHIPRTADERAPWLNAPGACFVTLTRNGQLRGCIGSLAAHRTLLADVKSNAVSAALHDPRFMPMTVAELENTKIEISLLTPAELIEFKDEADALSQLRPGSDGVIFQYGSYYSTFLPQVWEQLPSPGEFMAHLKRKAGLPEDFWADGIRLSRYTVTKFIEDNQ
ncbi:MAG: AMMECR1 domain-containing protein [Gallionellales bacterium RIFOXYB12_FULL_54_9]|nr:MAG: AMMECR1 domain-containing protein [Gallionellales bacterium RIFOXYB12_FULL_54_9]